MSPSINNFRLRGVFVGGITQELHMAKTFEFGAT